jgi:hypothetical protein
VIAVHDPERLIAKTAAFEAADQIAEDCIAVVQRVAVSPKLVMLGKGSVFRCAVRMMP